eukprot:gb/GECG01002074.1/.p1 GENE.gb/GECG01002074.1/~~gb/GECG01002074.1/.p1  ORF type:complete len:303 (+),score=43.02 gb/GECG01002074.1/:1-909(+)
MLEGSTKIDHSVRKALEIPAKTPNEEGPGLEIDDINGLWDILGRRQVQKTLFDGKPTELKLNKLNIYEEGGFFARHVDHPAKDVVGTLVVILNQFRYRGGEFRLGNGVQIEHPLVPSEHDCQTSVAFYADVPHSIEPVKEGRRVSLSFYIMKGEDWENTVPNTYQMITNGQFELLAKAVKSLLDMHDEFGILMGHQYSIYETDEKGVDQPLLSVIKNLNGKSLVDSEIQSVVLNHHEEAMLDYSEDRSKTVEVFRCDLDDWNYLVGATLKKPPNPQRLPIYHCGESSGNALAGSEFTGNDGA